MRKGSVRRAPESRVYWEQLEEWVRRQDPGADSGTAGGGSRGVLGEVPVRASDSTGQRSWLPERLRQATEADVGCGHR